MSDVIFLGLVVGFFLIGAALIRACEAIIGDDDGAAS